MKYLFHYVLTWCEVSSRFKNNSSQLHVNDFNVFDWIICWVRAAKTKSRNWFWNSKDKSIENTRRIFLKKFFVKNIFQTSLNNLSHKNNTKTSSCSKNKLLFWFLFNNFSCITQTPNSKKIFSNWRLVKYHNKQRPWQVQWASFSLCSRKKLH